MNDSNELQGPCRFHVQQTTHFKRDENGKELRVRGFRAVAYPAHFTEESKTTESEAEAQDWAARLNRREKVPEAGVAFYADRD